MFQDTPSLEAILQSIAHIVAPNDVNAKITLDSRCPEGDTPLHVFVWRNEIEKVRILLRNGADINALGDMRQTPLHVAVMQENTTIANLLLQSGAAVSIVSAFGTTPLESAKAIGGDIYRLFQRHANLKR